MNGGSGGGAASAPNSHYGGTGVAGEGHPGAGANPDSAKSSGGGGGAGQAGQTASKDPVGVDKVVVVLQQDSQDQLSHPLFLILDHLSLP